MEKLAEICLRFKNLNPQLYEQFVNEFWGLTQVAVMGAVRADPGDILRVQGHAQRMVNLLEVYSNCDKLVASQEERRKAKQPAK